jgi:Putative Ig domain
MRVKALRSAGLHQLFNIASSKTSSFHICVFLLLLTAAAAGPPIHAEQPRSGIGRNTALITRFSRDGQVYSTTGSISSIVVTTSLPAGTVGVTYSGSISATGGVAPYAFAVTGGGLPSGLALNTTTGAVYGTPKIATTKNFWVRVTDSQGTVGRVHASLTIGNTTAPNSPTILVAVSPTTATISSGGAQQFSATVQGTSNTAVNWSTSLGSISSDGLFTAPTVTSNTSVTVTAKSAADPTQNASAFVTVVPPLTPVSVSISPTSASLASGGSKQFTALVQGTTDTAVTWASSAGTISSSGMFTAPVVTANATVSVTATSVADSTKKATASVSLSAAPSITVSVSPSSVSMPPGDTQQFIAAVQGTTNTAVSWSSTAGTISSSGLFTAPTVWSTTTITITATSAADSTKEASASVIVSAGGTSGNVGCGVASGGGSRLDQSTCGNYPGAPYEDMNTASPTTAPLPFGSGTIHTITSCTSIVPTAGDVWRFGSNISDGVGGTNQKCIYFAGQNANNFVIDLAGHTLTGGIKCDQSLGGNDCSGITIVNGTVNCNIATGSSVSCITLTQGSNPSKSILLSHLTVNNSNSPSHPDGTYTGFEYAILIQAGGTSAMGPVPAGAGQKTFNGAGIEEAHLTVTAAAGYTGGGYAGQWCARCTSIFNGGNAGVTIEAWNNLVPNNAYVDANQGIVFYHTGPASVHNNYFPWVRYEGTGDTGRPILLDAAGKAFDQAGGEVFNNLIEAYNNRCVRTRQVNHVFVHDNRFEHVQSTTVDPCIMMGGNGDYSEKIDGNVVSNNTFTHAGGTSIEAAESYGLVADGNTFVCESNCSSGTLGAAWIAEGNNGLTFKINSASRTAGCVVTLNLAASPSTTSVLAGTVYVNVNGRADSLNVSGTAGNLVTSISGPTVTYTQAGCSGAYSGGAGGVFWMAQSKVDNFPANGAAIYVKNSIVDPQLTMATPFIACGTAGPACQNPPQLTKIQWCNNTQDTSLVPALGGTGAIVLHATPDSACP